MAEDIFENMLAKMDITQRQQAVLRASMELFATQGFNQTSTRQIAQKAGVAEGTVYKQFKTKQEILTAILTPVREFVIPQVTTEFTQEILVRQYPGLGDLVHEMILNRLQLVDNNRNFARLMCGSFLEQPRLRQEVAAAFTKQVAAPFLKIFEFYQNRGQIRADLSTQSIVQLMISTLLGYTARMVLLDQHFDLQTAADEGTSLVMHGIANS